MAHANQAAAVPAKQPRRWPGLLLLIVAIIELMGGIGALPILAGNLDEIPGPGLGGKIIIATIILHPIAAAVALFFLVRGHLPGALVSMAVVILLGWISYLPSIQLHGLEPQGDGAGGLFTFALIILPPVLVVAITALALTGKRLTLATILALLPTLISILSVVAFGIGVAIYGF
jgi:hypothetical protein